MLFRLVFLILAAVPLIPHAVRSTAQEEELAADFQPEAEQAADSLKKDGQPAAAGTGVAVPLIPHAARSTAQEEELAADFRPEAEQAAGSLKKDGQPAAAGTGLLETATDVEVDTDMDMDTDMGMDVDVDVDVGVEAEAGDADVEVEVLDAAYQQELLSRQAKYKGTVLRNQFVLEELESISSSSSDGDKANEASKATPGSSFPSEMNKRYSSQSHPVRHLGQGNFGDTWRAWDTSRKEYVAVKIFYDDAVEPPRYIYVDEKTSSAQLDKLSHSRQECTNIKKLVRLSLTMDTSVKGYVKYLCQCYEDHIYDQGTEPAFLVYEMCGKETWSIVKWRFSAVSKETISRARTITNYLVRGLVYLASLSPPYIHHDLKPENLCYSTNQDGSYNVKIIDWDALFQADPEDQAGTAAYTPGYNPPDRVGQKWQGKPWTWDIYGAGVIYAQLLCPAFPDDTFQDLDTGSWRKGVDVKEVLVTKCPKLKRLTTIGEDTAIISGMVEFDNKQRTSPREVNRLLEDLRGRGVDFSTG